MTISCPICSKSFRSNSRAIECDNCQTWYHLKCTELTLNNYRYYACTDDLWLYSLCRDLIFPFNNIETTEIIEMAFNSNTNCFCSRNIACAKLEHLPRLNIVSSFGNSDTFSQIDPESNLPSMVNFKYYSTHDFHQSSEISSLFSNKSFSIIHCNIRSLAKNYDSLVSMLDELQLSFDVIGLSEIKFKIDKDQLVNTSSPNYKFVSQPSRYEAGGVGFYIHNKLKT